MLLSPHFKFIDNIEGMFSGIKSSSLFKLLLLVLPDLVYTNDETYQC